jgi:hypothetical protein
LFFANGGRLFSSSEDDIRVGTWEIRPRGTALPLVAQLGISDANRERESEKNRG